MAGYFMNGLGRILEAALHAMGLIAGVRLGMVPADLAGAAPHMMAGRRGATTGSQTGLLPVVAAPAQHRGTGPVQQ